MRFILQSYKKAVCCVYVDLVKKKTINIGVDGRIVF